MSYAEVALPIPIDKKFTYEVPASINILPLSRVIVPFRRRKLVGFAVHVHEKAPSMETKRIEDVLDQTPLITPDYLEWLQWAARYYFTPLGEVLATALPSSLLKSLSQSKIEKMKARNSPVTDHWIIEKEVPLNEPQSKIFNSLKTLADSHQFTPTLLYGVTGSGKTEIYLHLIDHVLQQKKQALFLVPEIGLTPQIVARFRHFFGDKLGLFHSGLTENQRLKEWMRARSDEISVMVGTRSALFAPFKDLGIIILDEEQDSSYKQEERFRYHARDLALVRGKIEKCMVLLGSATPSLESFQNAKDGKFHFFQLLKRAGGAKVPQIKIVDMAAQKRQRQSPLLLSKELFDAITQNLVKKEQTLILYNRRGFARSFLCLACNQPVLCKSCSVNLIYHKHNSRLVCHYCDGWIPLLKKCPNCESHKVTLLGSGTQTLEEELKTYFPKARIARLDRDATQKKGILVKTLKNLVEQKIDILIGTQMIAKGHDIPRVTLVGVLGGDASLGIPDFRGEERTFQLMTQVAGRSGRGDLPGRVIIQTYFPEHLSIQLACKEDFHAFFESEIKNRKELGYPPAGRLIEFKFSSNSERKITSFLDQLNNLLSQKQTFKLEKGIQILGPSPSPIEKIRGRYRWHLLIKGKKVSTLQSCARKISSCCEKLTNSGIKWSIDVDPINML